MTFSNNFISELDDGMSSGVHSPDRDIPCKNEVFSAVRKYDYLLWNLTKNLPGFVYTYRREPDGREGFVFVSSGIHDIYGLKAETVISDLSALRALFHPEDLPGFNDAINESARSGEVFHWEFRVRNPLKGERWVESRAVPEKQCDGAILWHGLTLDVTVRKRVQLELADRERAFRTLAKNTPDPIYRYDPECRRIYVNPAVERLSGVPAEKLLGKTPVENRLVAKGDAVKGLHSIQKVFATAESDNVELLFITPDGRKLYYEHANVPEFNADGGVDSVLSIGRDITAVKQLKSLNHELRKNEKVLSETMGRLSSLFCTIPDLIWLKNPEGVYLTCNEAYARFLDLNSDEMIGKTDFDFYDPEAAGVCRQSDYEAISSGTVTLSEEHMTLANGEEIICEIRKAPIYGEDGKLVSVMGIGRDITERKRMEEVAARREREFRTLAENSPNIIMRYDRDLIRTYVNPAYVRHTGIPAETALNSRPGSQCKVHLNMMGMNAEVYRERLINVMDTGQSDRFQVEWQRVTDGEYVAHELHVVAEKDDDGRIGGLLVIGHDITAIKRQKELLEQKEREFRSLAENSPDIIVRYDCKLRRVYANPGWAQLNGIPTEAVLGLTPAQKGVCISAVASDYEAYLRRVLDTGKSERFELSWTNTEGRLIFLEQRAVPEYDNEGRITGVLTVASDITERKLSEQRIAHMAHHDNLTGLPNRILAGIKMDEMIGRTRRDRGKAALIFIDLDNFKAVNDSLGHSSGDVLLNAVAMRLKNSCRRSDAMACRHGGDEFLLILDDPAETDDILRAVEDVRKGLEAPLDVNGRAVSVSVSIGIAVFPGDGDNFETLLKKADTAMCRAKEFGRDTHCFYAEEMNRHLDAQLHILNDLKQAMVAGELRLYYQPQIDAITGAITGAEALLRWEHPTRGLIPPLQFIPLAESSGLIIPIGKWIIEQACRQAAAWHEQRMELTVAVNISAVQFKRGDLVETVRQALEVSGLEARFLELELTESVIMQDTDKTLSAVRQLKRLGVRLAIDDFGTGYSSLAYLKRFAVDKLKIDRSFVRDIVHDADDTAIVRAIIQMSKSLGIVTVAEGVEDQDTLTYLQKLDCDVIQGFLYSPALKATDFTAFSKEYSTVSMAG